MNKKANQKNIKSKHQRTPVVHPKKPVKPSKKEIKIPPKDDSEEAVISNFIKLNSYKFL